MKVGFVLDDTLDSTDGVQQYVLTVGDWLSKKGFDVHYVVGKTKRKDLDNIHTFGKNIPVKFNKNRLSIPLPSSPRKIREMLVFEDFDVLHVQMPHSPMLAARIVDLAPESTAIVGTFHIAPFSNFERNATKLLGFYLKPNIARFDQILSVSPAAKELAQKAFGRRSVVIPNAVDISRFKRTDINHDVTTNKDFVFLGRLVSRKGCHHLLRSYKIFCDRNPQINNKLHICGDGQDRKKLESYAQKNNLSSRVIFHGRVSEKDKQKYLGSARTAIFPSTGGESFGIVLIEAMASGSGIVLGGNNPGYSSVLGEGSKTLFDPDDHVGLAGLMTQFLDDKYLEEAHNNQHKLLDAYDIENVGPKIMNVYKTVIAKRSEHIHNGA